MGKILKIFLAIFAAYRLASLISREEGPYLPFLYKDYRETGFLEKIRERLGAYRYGSDGFSETNLARGISCPLCVGVYLSFILTFFVRPKNSIEFFLTWFGISGAQVFLENLTLDSIDQNSNESMEDSFN